MRDVNALVADPAWELIDAFAINDEGDIVAIGSHDGADRVVVLKRGA